MHKALQAWVIRFISIMRIRRTQKKKKRKTSTFNTAIDKAYISCNIKSFKGTASSKLKFFLTLVLSLCFTCVLSLNLLYSCSELDSASQPEITRQQHGASMRTHEGSFKFVKFLYFYVLNAVSCALLKPPLKAFNLSKNISHYTACP